MKTEGQATLPFQPIILKCIMSCSARARRHPRGWSAGAWQGETERAGPGM